MLLTLTMISRRKKEEGRRKKEEGRRKKEEGRNKNVYTVSFLAILILCLIRWIYLTALVG
ncbi:hypothetical protein [Phormidium nigroviride]